MSRTIGAFQYKKEAEKEILKCVDIELRTTNEITKLVRNKFSKIHFITVLRILNKFEKERKVISVKAGRTKFWHTI